MKRTVLAVLFSVIAPAVTHAQLPTEPQSIEWQSIPQILPVDPLTNFLNQPPDLNTCAYSDPTYVQIMAEDLVVGAEPIEVDEIILFVSYHPNNTPPASDDVTVRFYDDAGSMLGPGTLLSEEFSVPTSRVDTGNNNGFGLDEYQLTLSLMSPMQLAAGQAFWIEVDSDSGDTSNRFCWDSAAIHDPTNGRQFSSVSRANPPTSWSWGSLNLAIQVNGTTVPVELESFSIER